jgi:two-component system sensor histidine kinase UhpB
MPEEAEGPLLRRYEILLQTGLTTVDEAALHTAHDFGRHMLNHGRGVLDVVALHGRLVNRALENYPLDRRRQCLDGAGRLLLESLTPFEMTHRGFNAASTALQASEDRYREIFENAHDMIFTADMDGRITSINRAGEIMCGYSRHEALALEIHEIFVSEQGRASEVADPRLRVAALLSQPRTELEMVARDGRRIPVEISARAIGEHGEPVGIQGISRDITDRRDAESVLRYLNRHLEDKAKRIAHALHDEAGQLLASVYLRVAEISGELPPLGRRRMEELRTLLDQVDDQLRRLAHELRPTILDDLGLVPACQFLAEGVSRRARVRVVVKGSTGGRLSADIETALYRVAQEALGNAGRHAHARAATVEFERVGSVLRGSIRDDGAGFDVAAVLSRVGNQGLGLMGMRERVVALGGRFTVKSSPGQGTSIEFEVPLEA